MSFENFILILPLAFLWAGVAQGYAAAANRKLAMLPFVAITTGIAAVCCGIIQVRWSEIHTIFEHANLIIVMAIGGILIQCAIICCGKAMQDAPSHKAAIWTIFSMYIIFPFFYATVFWSEPTGWYQWVGLGCLLVSLPFISPVGEKNSKQNTNRSTTWKVYITVAFLLGGVATILFKQSALCGWADKLQLRATVSLGASSFFLWVFILFKKPRISAIYIKLGILTSIFIIAGDIGFYWAIDSLASSKQIHLIYPVAVGGQIIVFSAIQFLTRNEHLTLRKACGIALAILGIVSLSL